MYGGGFKVYTFSTTYEVRFDKVVKAISREIAIAAQTYALAEAMLKHPSILGAPNFENVVIEQVVETKIDHVVSIHGY